MCKRVVENYTDINPVELGKAFGDLWKAVNSTVRDMAPVWSRLEETGCLTGDDSMFYRKKLKATKASRFSMIKTINEL